MTYPVMLSLKGKKCLVVGAGNVAKRKTKRLLTEGADVYVVSPECEPYFAVCRKIKIISRKFRPADLDAKFLVIAATDDKELNSRICRLAQKRNMLANNAGARQNANFMNMAEIRKNGITIAFSSAGRDVKAAVSVRNRKAAAL